MRRRHDLYAWPDAHVRVNAYPSSAVKETLRPDEAMVPNRKCPSVITIENRLMPDINPFAEADVLRVENQRARLDHDAFAKGSKVLWAGLS